MCETNPVKILASKAKRLRKQSGNLYLRSKLETGRSPRDILLGALIRPAKMFVFSPIILALSSFVAIIFGYLYILFTTFPFVFEDQYGFSSGTVGLTCLGLGIGCFVGLLVFGSTSDKIIRKKAGSEEMKPEYRLLPMIYGAPCIPIGLFWYGWSAEAHTHWIVPVIGAAFVGIDLIATIVSSVNQILVIALKVDGDRCQSKLISSMHSQSMLHQELLQQPSSALFSPLSFHSSAVRCTRHSALVGGTLCLGLLLLLCVPPRWCSIDTER
jgi:MFS family permease